MVIDNSTVSMNSVSSGRLNAGKGGGLYSGRGTLTFSSSTVSGNSAQSGGGIYGDSGTSATFQNSIVANSLSGGNCDNHGTMTSNGYNLSSDGTCNFNGPGDLNNTDPVLGPLQNNGGPTLTQALLAGSPAIDVATQVTVPMAMANCSRRTNEVSHVRIGRTNPAATWVRLKNRAISVRRRQQQLVNKVTF